MNVIFIILASFFTLTCSFGLPRNAFWKIANRQSKLLVGTLAVLAFLMTLINPPQSLLVLAFNLTYMLSQSFEGFKGLRNHESSYFVRYWTHVTGLGVVPEVMYPSRFLARFLDSWLYVRHKEYYHPLDLLQSEMPEALVPWRSGDFWGYIFPQNNELLIFCGPDRQALVTSWPIALVIPESENNGYKVARPLTAMAADLIWYIKYDSKLHTDVSLMITLLTTGDIVAARELLATSDALKPYKHTLRHLALVLIPPS